MKMHLAVGVFCFAAFSSVFAHIGHPSSCCLKLSSQLNKVSVKNVIDFKWQIKGVCPVTAVVVMTRRGIQLCADPDVDWTKRAMSRVDSLKRRSEEEKNRNTAALTPGPPAEGNREEPPAAPTAPTAPRVYSWHPESPSPPAPTDQLKTSRKSVTTAQSSRRRGKGERKRKTKRKGGKKKAKKTRQ